MSSDSQHINPLIFFYSGLIYSFFIIYGSLVPLDYHPRPLEEAWLSFQQIRYLDLGAASRADWVANIILYIPLTFFLTGYFTNKVKSLLPTFFITTFILAGSITLAITLEFYQQFFPPRTVSQNDLIAETIGSIIGLVLWFSYGKRILELHTHIQLGGKNAFLASATLYTLSYFALSFFPYDFVTSFQELHNKISIGNDAFLISPSCGDLIRCTTKLTSEILLALPLGIFFSVLLKWHRQRLTAVMLIGFVFGAIIEAIQLFLISGIAQGISVLTRILGMGFGEILYKKIIEQKKTFLTPALRKYILIASVPYILLLAGLNGWSFSNATLASDITEKLAHINWLPFYYHYYTSESVALTSLLSILFMYMPVGLGMWLWNNIGNHKTFTGAKFKAGFYAAGLTLVMETSKLFLVSKHPDPTNLLIGFASAFLTYSIADVMYQWFHQPETAKYNHRHADSSTLTDSPIIERATQNASSINKETGNLLAKIIAVLIFAILSWKLIDYPGSSVVLGSALLLYAILLYKYPQAWLIAIPALLPILDFAPWTGRIFFSEFDYFILTTLALSYWYGRSTPPFQTITPIALFLLGIYTFFYLISMVKGLLPFQPLDANAFTHYYSHYNSLRIGKGFFWALFLLPILSYNLYNQKNTTNYFAYGILFGLTAISLFAFWERTVFTGLLDFSSDFRITSTFYSMHTGGAHLDAFLLISMPFICFLLTDSRHKLQNSLFAMLLFAASLYTLLMTFSRGAYIAFVIEFIVLCLGLMFCYKQELATNWKKALWIPVFVILVAVISTPILKGTFIQNRFQQFNEEVDIRSSHWRNSINMMDTDLVTTFFGMGLGSFPRNYFWKSFDEITPATFALQQEQDYSYLQIRGGAPLYIEQNVAAIAHTDYKLQLDYRTYSDNSGLNIQICEKAVQHSFNCQGVQLSVKNNAQNWQHFEQNFNTKNTGGENNVLGVLPSRPVKLILYNGQKDTPIDIKNITLTSPAQTNLIKNGDFAEGMDHWFFTADDHIPWRTENLWVQILFEQGWLGLLTFTLLLLATIIYLYQQLTLRQIHSAVFLSSLTGFIVISVVDSSFDAPKITLLFFLFLLISFSEIKPKTIKRYT